jgi:hypothetical protein
MTSLVKFLILSDELFIADMEEEGGNLEIRVLREWIYTKVGHIEGGGRSVSIQLRIN